MASCLFGLDSAAMIMLIEQHFRLFGQIRTYQTVGQPLSETSPYGECSLDGSTFYYMTCLHFAWF